MVVVMSEYWAMGVNYDAAHESASEVELLVDEYYEYVYESRYGTKCDWCGELLGDDGFEDEDGFRYCSAWCVNYPIAKARGL